MKKCSPGRWGQNKGNRETGKEQGNMYIQTFRHSDNKAVKDTCGDK